MHKSQKNTLKSTSAEKLIYNVSYLSRALN